MLGAFARLQVDVGKIVTSARCGLGTLILLIEGVKTVDRVFFVIAVEVLCDRLAKLTQRGIAVIKDAVPVLYLEEIVRLDGLCICVKRIVRDVKRELLIGITRMSVQVGRLVLQVAYDLVENEVGLLNVCDRARGVR